MFCQRIWLTPLRVGVCRRLAGCDDESTDGEWHGHSRAEFSATKDPATSGPTARLAPSPSSAGGDSHLRAEAYLEDTPLQAARRTPGRQRALIASGPKRDLLRRSRCTPIDPNQQSHFREARTARAWVGRAPSPPRPAADKHRPLDARTHSRGKCWEVCAPERCPCRCTHAGASEAGVACTSTSARRSARAAMTSVCLLAPPVSLLGRLRSSACGAEGAAPSGVPA